MVSLRRIYNRLVHGGARVPDDSSSNSSQEPTEKQGRDAPDQKPSIEKQSIFGTANAPKEDDDALLTQLAASRDESKALKAEVEALKQELGALKAESGGQGTSGQALQNKNQTGGNRELDRMIRDGGAQGAVLKQEPILLKESLNSSNLEELGNPGGSGQPPQSENQDVESKDRNLASKIEGPSGSASKKEPSDPFRRYIGRRLNYKKSERPQSKAPSTEASSTEASSTEASSTEASSTEASSNEPSNQGPSKRAPPKKVPRKKASFLELPTEIKTHIVGFLPPESVISFAMTCRRYYLSYFPEWPSLDAKSTETLLIMLEKDVPNLLHCSKCAILHTWKLCPYSNASYMSGVYPSRSCRYASAFEAPNGRESIQYQSARLAMNYHLYGPTHGFPLNMLEMDGERRDEKTSILVKSTQQARIVDDELFLRISRKVHNPNGGMKRLESFLRDDSDQKICRHHTIWSAPQRSSADPAASASPAPVVDDGSPAPLSLPPFLANFPLGVVFSCTTCLVDAEVKASWYGTTERWSVTIDTWMQLGACRSPDDPKWKAFQYGGGSLRVRKSEPQNHPAGAVRRRWGQGDGEDLSDMEAHFFKK